MQLGRHARDRLGYLAGRDPDRTADLNAAIADPKPLVDFSDMTPSARGDAALGRGGGCPRP